MTKQNGRLSKKGKPRSALALPQYLKDPIIRELHNDTLDLYRRTYGVRPSQKKMQGFIHQYGYKRVRYALLIVQQYHTPKKKGAILHFKKILSRTFPSPEQVAKLRAHE